MTIKDAIRSHLEATHEDLDYGGWDDVDDIDVDELAEFFGTSTSIVEEVINDIRLDKLGDWIDENYGTEH